MSMISAYILEFLKEHQQVQMLDFGTFVVKNSAAKVVEENNNILPPAKEIDCSLDTTTGNIGFAEYVASKEKIMYHEAMSILRKTSEKWLSDAKEQGSISIEGLGRLSFSDDVYQFQGERLTSSSPDFFGLEEINLEQLNHHTASINDSETDNDPFGKTILWSFLIAIPVTAIIYLAFTQRNKLLGKDTVVVKTATHRIPKKSSPVKVDSIKSDSLIMTKVDSIFGTTQKKPQ